MKIYYFANQIYQFSYSIPIYKRLGGTFIVRKYKKLLSFKKLLRNTNVFPNVKTFLNTPPIVKLDIKNLYDLKGIIISQSNTRINCNHQKCKTIFVGHGSGDKRYGGNEKILKSYDYHFLSGPKHMQKLRDVCLNIPEEKLVKIGNLRFDDYVNNKINREEVLDTLGVKDRGRKNVLYAPTWRWGSGTFKKFVYQFCREITKEFNLIVRPHYHDSKRIPKVKIWAKLHGIKHVYFSNSSKLLTNDTMQDFMVSDILISDTSSVLYEYLITGKPIIIAKTNCDELHTMPDDMNIMKYADIYDGSQNIVKMIENNLLNQPHKNDYKKLLNNCFYYNDGKSVERAMNFLRSIYKE